MKSFKKALAALISKEKTDWDVQLPAVSLAYNSTPPSATRWLLFFLSKSKEAVLPIQRHLDELRLDLVVRKWLSRLWKSRLAIVEGHKRETDKKRRLSGERGTVLIRTIIAVQLSFRELEQHPAKFAFILTNLGR